MTAEAIPGGEGAPTSSRRNDLGRTVREIMPRVRDFFVNVIGQVRILRKVYPGVMHLLIFWGVTIQVIGTAINLMQMALFIPFVELTFPRAGLYLTYELIMDLAGVAILAGVTMAAIRRIFMWQNSLQTQWDDAYALLMLALIPIVGFTVEATRILSAQPEWAAWSPVGSFLANALAAVGMTPETAAVVHDTLFWTHAGLALLFLTSIPFTKLRHLVFMPLNIVLHPQRKEGVLEKIEDIEETEILGVGDVAEFAPQQLLSFDACVRCGRCEEACPCTISGMDYSPKTLIQTLRGAMVDELVTPNGNGKSGLELLGEVMPDEYAWVCTTCGACIESCPGFINPVDEIIDLRRYQALTTGQIPKSVADTMRNMERQGNPWGMPAEDRMAWAGGLEVRELAPGDETDVLLFMGCASAYDDRNKKVARSFVKLLHKLKVDFAVLGLDEICCGETARRMGNEYLFQVYAEQNIEAFNQVKFKRIVTQCPHCFNTLKNEYLQMGGDFKVQHYTEFLDELELPQGSFSPGGNGLDGSFSYHDSCYLGRYNQIYSQPRQLLERSQVKQVELPRNMQNSFCCGGGGGQMWMETDPNTRISHRRLDEALQVGADVIATACPYCLLMFDDAIRSKALGEQVQVMDIAEVLEKQLGD
jgi:Fe-S oxidoreductase/nitrate reductase gamma subunit